MVTLNATPAVNLISWGGACSGSAATCTVTMDADKTVTASFKDTPLISGLPTALTFATQNIGSTSTAQSATLTNTGGATLNISSIAASGDYARTTTCGATLEQGASCSISVTFTPTAAGTRSGTITITSNATGSPHSIALSGTGQGRTSVVSPSSLSFASQGVGKRSAAKTVTLSHTGGLAINIASIVANGDFARTTTCGATLAQAASCSISVTFTPTVVGARSGSVVITSDAASSPNTVSLSGTGTAVALVSLSPASLSFVSQGVGTSSAAQTVTLTNSGGASLNLTSITASGDFAVTNNCDGGLAAGGSCSLNVTFTPTATGTRTGTITITSNATGSPHSVSLSGAVASFPNNRNNYSITKTSTGFSVRDNVGAGGTVELAGATQIKFADMTVNLLIGDLSKTIPADSLKTLIELYVAFFNRIPESDGLSYWITQFKAGSSINQIAESFYAAGIQYSSLTGFSAGMTPDDFINTIYRNVLGRPDGAAQGGMDYWKPKLLDGSATHGSLVTDILYSAHTYKGDPTWGWVADLLDNKYSVATFFCLQQGLNYNTPEIAIAEGMAIAAAVTPTSIAAAIALIEVTDAGFDLTAP